MQNTIFKALAHPARRKIMDLLKDGPMTSGDLASVFDAAWPTITRHLTVLKDADLISAERQGNSILYRANASVLEGAVAALLALMGTDNLDDDMKDAAE